MFCEPEEDDEDDYWFFDSIKRYEDLLMFDVQGIATNGSFSTDDEIFLTCCRSSSNEILELNLPDNLRTVKNADVVKNRDFKIKSAGYCNGQPSQIIASCDNIATSESQGVEIYNLGDNDSDIISHSKSIRCNLQNPLICYCQNDSEQREKAVIFSATNLQNIERCDLRSEKVEKCTFSDIDTSSDLSYFNCLNSTLICGLKTTGTAIILDSRTKLLQQSIKVQKSNCDHWTYCCSPDNNHLAIANNNLHEIQVYDRRNTSKVFLDISLSSYKSDTAEDPMLIQFDNESNFMSVSGFEKSVLIFSLKEIETEPVFVHDGHKKTSTKLLFHIWHPSTPKLLFSADDKSALHAWRFR